MDNFLKALAIKELTKLGEQSSIQTIPGETILWNNKWATGQGLPEPFPNFDESSPRALGNGWTINEVYGWGRAWYRFGLRRFVWLERAESKLSAKWFFVGSKPHEVLKN